MVYEKVENSGLKNERKDFFIPKLTALPLFLTQTS